MAANSGEKEKAMYNPILTSGIGTKGERAFSAGLSSTPKNRDGDQTTPNSIGADMHNMDELIQRLSRSTRQGALAGSLQLERSATSATESSVELG